MLVDKFPRSAAGCTPCEASGGEPDETRFYFGVRLFLVGARVERTQVALQRGALLAQRGEAPLLVAQRGDAQRSAGRRRDPRRATALPSRR